MALYYTNSLELEVLEPLRHVSAAFSFLKAASLLSSNFSSFPPLFLPCARLRLHTASGLAASLLTGADGPRPLVNQPKYENDHLA